MEVQFTPEQEAQLAQLARHNGQDAAQFVQETVSHLLAEDARLRAGVRRGIAQADRGEFIEEEEMDARVARILGS